ncbi:hypothetical protein C8039_15790 [Halogeometricum sp. wsp3]|nr:hypothetical protein C8039_15790 [Halogeometricum sp. wsp3]
MFRSSSSEFRSNSARSSVSSFCCFSLAWSSIWTGCWTAGSASPERGLSTSASTSVSGSCSGSRCSGPVAAFLVAGIVYISSAAIITKSLIDLGWIANDEANPLFGTLVFEDLFIAVYLTIAAALVTGGSDLGAAATSVGVALSFIVALLLLARYGTPWFERAFDDFERVYCGSSRRYHGIISGLALAIGVSEAVAAFFVGMGFATSGSHAEDRTLLEPLRDTFAAVFSSGSASRPTPTVRRRRGARRRRYRRHDADKKSVGLSEWPCVRPHPAPVNACRPRDGHSW